VIFRKYVPTYLPTYLPIYAQAVYTRCIMKSQKTYQTRSCARYRAAILSYKPRIFPSPLVVIESSSSFRKRGCLFSHPGVLSPHLRDVPLLPYPTDVSRRSRSTATLPVHLRKIPRDETSCMCMQQCAWNRPRVPQLLRHWCRLSLRSRSLYSSSLSPSSFSVYHLSLCRRCTGRWEKIEMGKRPRYSTDFESGSFGDEKLCREDMCICHKGRSI